METIITQQDKRTIDTLIKLLKQLNKIEQREFLAFLEGAKFAQHIICSKTNVN